MAEKIFSISIWNFECCNSAEIRTHPSNLIIFQITGDLVSPTPQPKLRQKGGTTFLPIPNTISPKEETLEVALSRGGISIVTRRLVADGSAMSTVSIQNPTPAHSGKYACRPANLDPAYVNLHVIQGKKIHSFFKSKSNESRMPFGRIGSTEGLQLWGCLGPKNSPKIEILIILV